MNATTASLPATTLVSKRPPQKKRHTKPCRYFQTGSCPHTEQEDCDFAHVISDGPPPPAPKQCRYYLQGSCTNGIWCQYRHGEAAPEEVSLLQESPSLNGRTADSYGGFAPASPTLYIPSSPGIYPPWSPYTDGFHSPLDFNPPSHLLPQLDCFSPTLSPNSLEPETPASSPTMSDNEVFEDAASHHNNYFALQQPGYISYNDDNGYPPPPMSPMSPIPGFAPAVRMQLSVVPPPSYGVALYDIFSPKSAGFPSSVFSPHSQIKGQRAANYRTKPCKYFKPGSVCPSGDECTFIHVAPTEDPNAAAHGLPTKPVTQKEENMRKGFFPISWRVIGGGVRLSGSSTSSGGKEFSDVSDFDSDYMDDPVQETSWAEDPPPAAPLSAPAVAVAFPSSDIPDTETSQDGASESSGATAKERRRASSIPSALMAGGHVDILRLFSAAESPGGL
ncbi:hypothetical protein FB45DRAFT_283274 [Roridomyces roridus]|uniref:C3H1-type domain-containing protein n=1 Tax=Roridomyces roridus TaxID=1738132 RepID=A0AAD7FUH7_9AGAR|nr:hypothetical protein FB45DRAFT_283274 [Roridomyces roridus]